MTGPIIIAEIRKNAKERLRVSLTRWQGIDLVDVRVTTQLNEATGEYLPTKKGVTLAVARLPELARALADAERQARAMGLLDG